MFLKALEMRSVAGRQEYLNDACSGDPALRAEVEALLEADARAGHFLESPAHDPVETLDQQPVNEGPGTVIGPYTLREQIGEGGFGLVFMAEQRQPVRRKVAVKVIKPGMDSRQVIARFEAERQALALMDHPNIARVLDVGETESGRPYFAMELVRGLPITDYCDEHKLATRARLELFVSVCQAVLHAHQKGIIHRDIKPSNVLVTLHDGVPVVKVIDFGIAKALGQQLTEKTLCTGYAQLVGTPLYMSPEQAELSGLDIDTRSDIYSLGVLLYELLTGMTPFDKKRLREVGYDEMRRIIREEEPPRPSTRLSTLGQAGATMSERRQSDPRRLSQLLRGELDWIVMKALEKDRNQRYETASAFAADVQRYLADEAVLACPPSAGYRLRKFARRNKRGLATTGLVLSFIVSVAIGVGWVVRDRAAREQDIARDRSAREAALDGEVNRAVDEGVALIHDSKWPEALVLMQRTEKLLTTAGRQPDAFPPTLQELDKDVKMALRLEEIHSRPGRQELQLIDQEVAPAYARAFQDFGIDVTVLSVAEAAERIRGRSIRLELARALDIWSGLRRRPWTQGAPDWKLLLAIAKLADPDPWRNQLREALERGDRKGLQALAAAANVRQLPPGTLHLLGIALNEIGAGEQAVQLLRQAQRQYPEDLWLNDTLGWFSISVLRPRQYDEGVRYYTAAVALRPLNPYMVLSLGRILQMKGSYLEAIPEFTKAIELKPDLWDAWWDRGVAYAKLGKLDESIADYSKPTEMVPQNPIAWINRGGAYCDLRQWDKALADDTQAIGLDPTLAIAWNNRGFAYQQLGQWKEALVDCSKAVELDPTLGEAWFNRSEVYRYLRQWDKALADCSKAVEAFANYARTNRILYPVMELDPKLATVMNCRGGDYGHLGQWDKAVTDFTRAIELDPKAAASWNNRGGANANLGRFDKALADCKKAIELDPKFALALNNRAEVYRQLGQCEKALTDCNKAIELDPKLAVAFNNRGQAYGDLGQFGKALADHSSAIELDPDLAIAWNNRGGDFGRLGQWDKAVADITRAIELDPKVAEFWSNRGAAKSHLGQFDKAIDDYDKSIELDPKSKSVWNYRGNAYSHLKKWDKAIANYSKAIELGLKSAAICASRGFAYANLGQVDRAVADYTKAIELDPLLCSRPRTPGLAVSYLR